MKYHLVGTCKDTAMCTQCPKDINKFLEMLKKNGDNDDLFQEVDATSESESVNIKESLDTFLRKGSMLWANGKGKTRQTTMNEMVMDCDVVCKDICRILYAEEPSSNLIKIPFFQLQLGTKVNSFN